MNAAAVTNQKSVPLIPVDPHLLPNKNRVDVYRTLIATALKENIAPEVVDIKNVERLTMFIPPLLSAKINLVAEQHGMSFQEAFAGLTGAGAGALRKTRHEIQGIALEIKAPFPDARPEQLTFYQGIQAGMQLNKIVLAEASTGVGKGRAICAAAIEAANARKTPVLIAAPTLKILGQLWEEMDWLRGKGLGKKRSFSFFPGATEFVNKEKLIEFMQTHETDPDVAQWIRKGGKMLESKNPLKDAMKSMSIKPAWLMEDLRALAINMPADDFSLRSTEESEILQMLRDIRSLAKQTDIIFCTHAMLAISHMSGWALLPEPAVLVIDEAHQFEQSIASIYSNSVSMFSLMHRLNTQSKAPTKAVKAVRDFINTLRSINSDAQQINLQKEALDIPIEKIKEHIQTISDILKSKSHKDVEQIDNDKQALMDTLRSISGASTDRAYLSFSPDRRFPSIMAGKSNILGILGALWKTAQGGAVLASATIYTQDKFGDFKSDYIADVLALPSSRLYAPPPVIAKWVTDVPILHIPSAAKCSALARPNILARKESEDAEINWVGELVKEIKTITKNSKGGTLVLATSYWQVEQIAAGLAAAGVKKARIIEQKRERKMALTVEEFRELHKNGLRPIWVALGGAWTGLDLKKEKGYLSEDTVLTDLVIACCPVGLNRTNTMNARIDARHMQPITKEALMILKQGMGRLMRDERQTNRHIWILDGRIWNEWNGMLDFQKSVEAMLRNYPNQETF